jgi:tetratricopeptide (TPR) repeat protein
MVYPGNTELSSQAQERVLTAFRQVVTKLQEGSRDEAAIGLEFVLRLDPTFVPAVSLQQQLAAGAEQIDLSVIIDLLQAPASENVDELLVEAVDDFNNRRFLHAKDKVEQVLMELPGHAEARQLLRQLDEALKGESQVGQFLTQAREALDQGDAQEAANFVMMAQSLDPHHPGIEAVLEEIKLGPNRATPPTPDAPSAAPPPPVAAAPSEPVDSGGVAFGEADSAFEIADDSDDFGTIFADDEPVAGATEDVGSVDFGSSDEGMDLGGTFAASTTEDAPPLMVEADEPEESLLVPADEQPVEAPAQPLFGAASEAAVDSDWEPSPTETVSFGSGPEPAAPESDEALFTNDSGELADLFVSTAEEARREMDDASPEVDQSRITELIEQGQEAFDRGDFQAAIDFWSRVYLIEPAHEEVQAKIDAARAKKEEVERQVEHLFFDAQEAADSGDDDKAKELVEQVLAIHPNHFEAVELKERLSGAGPAPTAAPPPPGDGAALPELEDDLFQDDTPLAPIPEESLPAPAMGGSDAGAAVQRPSSGGRQLPWTMISLIAAGVVVVLVGVWFGTTLLDSGDGGQDAEALNRVLEQAEQYFQQGQVEEAIHLLQEYPATGLDQSRITTRLSRYQQALAPPTPTPVPDSVPRAEALYDQGRWLQAFDIVQRGLRDHPGDAGLMELKQRIMREPGISALHTALASADYRSAVGQARSLMDRYPDHTEFREELMRSLFNASVVELRAYNLTQAEAHLGALIELGGRDDEVDRILEFIDRYKTNPVDMRLKVFIGSLALR